MPEQNRAFQSGSILKIGITFLMIALLFASFACERKKNIKGGSVASDTSSQQSHSPEVSQPQGKLPRLVDLGADKCIPCKMMAPILEELKGRYAGQLEVEIVDVWKDPSAARQYGIRVIPTQIFYDVDGKEFYRHEGFISKEDILATFEKRGMNLGKG